ncbi:MAG: hypothetical protein KGL67_00180 [Patescibacteria group bacterium]|nr:hypothetical protein [Patescibacteria group bacterium]
MQKLKKSSNKKFTVIVFYGTFAVGKYTVANEFQKRTGYKFFHNHNAYDIARNLFERDTINLCRLYENINLMVFKEVADAKINVVTTHAFASSYVSKTGVSDPAYMKKIESIITRAGGMAIFVHLKADKNSLLKRVAGNSRKKFLKLQNPKLLKGILENVNKDWITSAPVKNNFIIDNTKLSPKKVADIIIKHFKIK